MSRYARFSKIQQRKENAGAALLALAIDVSEKGTFKNSHVDGLFDNDALGGLGCLPPVAEHVVKCFKNTEGYCFGYFEVLQYYFLNIDFSTFTQNADRLAWFQLLTEAVKPTEALILHCSTPAISNDYELQLRCVFNGFISLLFLEACSRGLHLEERNFPDTFTPPSSLKPAPIYSPILIRNDFELELDCENEADEAIHYSSDDKEILKMPVSLLCSFIFRFEKEHYALSKLHNNFNQLRNVMIFKLLFAITFDPQKIATYLNRFALDVLRSYKDKLKQKLIWWWGSGSPFLSSKAEEINGLNLLMSQSIRSKTT